MGTEWITPDGRWRVTAELANGVILLDFEELEEPNYNEYGQGQDE